MASIRKNKKRKMTPAASGECRINALPDRLLHRMLSFLPAHEAVRTSFLSHRWRHVWQSMRVLRVTAYELRNLWAPARFNEFVNHLLFLRDQVPLDGFTVTPYPIWVALGQPMGDSFEKVRYVETWIQYALMRDVRVLRVRNMPFTKYLLLAKLPPTSSHLRTLELQTVELDVRPLDFTSCPVLEKLKMRNCRISSLKLSFQSLRHLCITWCIFSPDICTLISAPNLLSLQLDVENGRLPFLGSMPLLDTALVEFSGSFTDRCGHSVGDCSRDACASCYGDRYGSCKRWLLGSLSNATHLELVDSSKTTLFKREMKSGPMFSKLKTLVLKPWRMIREIDALISFVKRTPILEKIVLQLDNDLTYYEVEMEASCSSLGKFVPSEHLRIVEVRCTKIVENVRKFVGILNTYGIDSDLVSIQETNIQEDT